MIQKYNNFIDELLLENIINEGIIFYSPPFREILRKMRKSLIASQLLNIEATDIEQDLTFIDVDKDGYLSFIKEKDAKKLIYAKFGFDIENMSYDDAIDIWNYDKTSNGPGVYLKSRNSIKLGKFINKILPDQHTTAEIEEFVNRFKSKLEGNEEFDIVEGEDFDKWYWYGNYAATTGNLGDSCMSRKIGFFPIYVQNPEVCRLLILKDDEGLLLGRAVVWKVDSIKITEGSIETKFEYFLDRVYVTKDSNMHKFHEYANKEGWAHKTENNYRSHKLITFNNVKLRAEMTVKINTGEYDAYPYMDTFARHDQELGILYNDNNDYHEYRGCCILNNTDGGRRPV